MSPATKRDTFLSHKTLRFSSEKANLLPVQIFNNFIESKTPNYDYFFLAEWPVLIKTTPVIIIITQCQSDLC